MKPSLSVIMCTYERPEHLSLALAGYLRQTVPAEFELLVADDGSGPSTAAVVERFAKEAPFAVRHVWQEDRGYRRTAILNRAIARASSDFIVFTDGDCIPAADLLAVHLARREPARILIGGYIRIPRELGDRVDESWVTGGAFEAQRTLGKRWMLYRRHLKNVRHILTRKRRRPHNLGLNMSAWTDDLLRVNGFDENIVDWGNDDGDLRDRLKQIGVWPKSIWHQAVVYHVDHPIEPSAAARRNREYARRRDIPAFAENGIVKRGEA